ncbi:TetR/AcrR family transcriptional regulator [Opitutus sp. GAS368]|jgi:AcrR family transcriptional regulator|uniref:TetR/AcrR family transcriptional regulator n=1 Tax=Opitutus sp. GAS368 TaxID=1882749 RepID=UPI00087C30E6|nr:TetR/AcrR family transcriptional regulator [Opitutus sp. GAS368]SDR88950.1 transcriptional regulator, TetR family [Opitutus sp. GAS368]
MPATTDSPAPSTPKRDHLLATAFRLFYRDGYHAVGIDTILAEAKLAKMTLYHHFASKEELIVAVLERRSAEVRARQAALLEAAGPSPRKRLLALLDQQEKRFASADFNGCPFIRAVAEYPALDSPVHQAVVRHKQRGIDLLAGLLAELEVVQPETVARQISLLLEGAIVTAHTFGDRQAAGQARAAALALVKAAA